MSSSALPSPPPPRHCASSVHEVFASLFCRYHTEYDWHQRTEVGKCTPHLVKASWLYCTKLVDRTVELTRILNIWAKQSRSSGKGGGVGVYISTSVPFHRRTDLEDEVIECIWIEILFPKTKSFLLELFTALQILQNIFALISIANLNQCFRQCHQKTKNVFLLVI